MTVQGRKTRYDAVVRGAVTKLHRAVPSNKHTPYSTFINDVSTQTHCNRMLNIRMLALGLTIEVVLRLQF
jgi:hypothetical protein